jgi:hypothetical protein
VTDDTIPIFINERPVRAPRGATLGQVLAEHDPELLAELLGGTAQATDARGLPVDPDLPVHAGAIRRVRRTARHQGGADA